MLDLSLSHYWGAIDQRRAPDIFRNDLRKNASSGYLNCQDFNLDQFDLFIYLYIYIFIY